MPIGPGKYDHLCTLVREQAGAEGVLVIVIEGKLGTGFSAQLTAPLVLRMDVPAVLRDIAAQIEQAEWSARD